MTDGTARTYPRVPRERPDRRGGPPLRDVQPADRGLPAPRTTRCSPSTTPAATRRPRWPTGGSRTAGSSARCTPPASTCAPARVDAPPAKRPVRSHAVERRDGEVWVRLSADAPNLPPGVHRAGSACTDPEPSSWCGASLAGHSVVAALREEGYDGRIVVVGDEAHPPYDRPPLSKGFLAGAARRRATSRWRGRRRRCRRRVAARAARRRPRRRRRRAVHPGRRHERQRRPRRRSPPARGPGGCPAAGCRAGVHHAAHPGRRDRAAGRPGARRAAGRGRGRVHRLRGRRDRGRARRRGHRRRGRAAAPGRPARRRGRRRRGRAPHARRGVDLRCGAGVAALRGTDRVEAVVLADGTELACDIVLVALGSVAAVDWLDGSGLDVDGGRASATPAGGPRAGVLAVGDCAAWFDPVLGRHHRVEHWTDAFDRARVAVARLLAPDRRGAAARRPTSGPTSTACGSSSPVAVTPARDAHRRGRHRPRPTTCSASGGAATSRSPSSA